MTIHKSIALPAFVLSLLLSCLPAPLAAQLPFDSLPPLPDEEGFAGMFAGVTGDVVLAAGGANFPEARPWEGGTKIWYDHIFAFENGGWRRREQTLPSPRAYGVSVSHDDAVVIAGGSDSAQHFATVFRLRYADGELETERLPDLPKSLANMAGALVGDELYIAGGTESPSATIASSGFYALNLALPYAQMQWRQLESWPGPERTQPVAASSGQAFYLFSGSRVGVDPDTGSPKRILPLLTDAYMYRPSPVKPPDGYWQKLPGMPRAAVAAPSPAPFIGQQHILLLGGVDAGVAAHTNVKEHPGFTHEILAYRAVEQDWSTLGLLPTGVSRVTAPTVQYQNDWLVVSGERRPGARSPNVLQMRRKSSFGSLNWLILILYLIVTLAIGFRFSRKNHSTSDFFLAGRRIPWWAAGISIYGTQLSAITFMSLPAVVYGTNWALVVGTLTIVAIVPVIVHLYLPYFRRLEITTVYELLESRFNLAVRWFGALSFLMLQLGRMGIVLFLPALALASVTGVDIFTCIILMGIVATIYTFLGGIEAVIWTDVLQVVVLLGGAVASVAVAASGVEGGLMGVYETGMALGKMDVVNPGWSFRELTLWVLLISFIFLNLTPYTSDQTVVQRYLTTKDEKAAARGVWTNGLMTFISVAVFYTLGTALYVFYLKNPGQIPAGRGEEILPMFILHNLPSGAAGLVIAGIFAATMSSLDSSMNSAATVCVNDFFRQRKKIDNDAKRLSIARYITLALGLLATGSAILLATFEIKYLFDYFQEILGLFGGSLTGVLILALFVKRSNAPGALVGGFIGALLPFVIKQSGLGLNGYLYGAVGVISCVIFGLIISAMTAGRFPPKPLELASN